MIELNWNFFEKIPEGYGEAKVLLDIRKSWHQRLIQLSKGNVTEDGHILAFTEFLLSLQKHSPDHLKGSFSLVPDSDIESDARVDFIYFPSYIAVAWLSLVKQNYYSLIKDKRGFGEVLRKGLRFICGRGLAGHGYDSDIERIEAIEILYLGNVFSMVRANPKLYAKFYRTMEKNREHLEKLDRKDGWGAVKEEDRIAALEMIS